MKKWKVIAVMAGIFLAGAVSGAVLATRVIQNVAERNLSPERWPATLIETYRRKLDLTPEQVEQMRPVVEQAREDWRRTMAGAVMGYGAVVLQVDRELKPLLTPDQLVKHAEIREEWQRRFREKFRANPGSE